MDIKQDAFSSLQEKIFVSIMMQLEVQPTKENIFQVKLAKLLFIHGLKKFNNLN